MISNEILRRHVDFLYRDRSQKLVDLNLADLLERNPSLSHLIEKDDVDSLVVRLVEDYLGSYEGWWQELIQDPWACMTVVSIMRENTAAKTIYYQQLAKARNRLSLEMIERFCMIDYKLDWEKLVLVNNFGSDGLVEKSDQRLARTLKRG